LKDRFRRFQPNRPGVLAVPGHVEGEHAEAPGDGLVVQKRAELAAVGARGVETDQRDLLSGLLEVEALGPGPERGSARRCPDRLEDQLGQSAAPLAARCCHHTLCPGLPDSSSRTWRADLRKQCASFDLPIALGCPRRCSTSMRAAELGKEPDDGPALLLGQQWQPLQEEPGEGLAVPCF